MAHHILELSDAEFAKLNATFPEENGSALIGKRAEEIVKLYFQRADPQCKFGKQLKGADLHVVFSDGRPPISIEIKGTKSTTVAWQQLKVSSEHSWGLLSTGQIELYRVCKVFAVAPEIHILSHGEHFTLHPEPRWALKRVANSDRSVQPQVQTRGTGRAREVEALTRKSKYESLRQYLESQTTSEVTLHFDDAQDLIGFELPDSARKHQAYWANQSNTSNRPWARAWQEAGFAVAAVNLSPKDAWVRFKRCASDA